VPGWGYGLLKCGATSVEKIVGMARVDPLTGYPALDPPRLKALIWTIASERCKQEWERISDTDFGYENQRARFRVNVFADRRGIGAVLRQIPREIKPAEQMGLSKQVLDLCFLTKGLVLVTGPTGSGKSTTLAGLVDYINRNRDDHIITIEDPIEFVHDNKRCLVNQREVGVNTGSFKQALRAALREDPDIVLVGELRDLETIAILIRDGKTFQIPSIMQTGRALGMVTMNDALIELVRKKVVDPREAYVKAPVKADFRTALQRAGYSLDADPTQE